MAITQEDKEKLHGQGGSVGGVEELACEDCVYCSIAVFIACWAGIELIYLDLK